MPLLSSIEGRGKVFSRNSNKQPGMQKFREICALESNDYFLLHSSSFGKSCPWLGEGVSYYSSVELQIVLVIMLASVVKSAAVLGSIIFVGHPMYILL